MENVAALAKQAKCRETLEKWVAILKLAGYVGTPEFILIGVRMSSCGWSAHSTSALASVAKVVRWDLLPSNEHGSAQHRERVFVLAIRWNSQMSSLMFWDKPPSLPLLPLSAYMDPAFNDPKFRIDPNKQCKTFKENVQAAKRMLKTSYMLPDMLVDVAAGKHRICGDRVPCITKTRGGGSSYFLPSQSRMLQGSEVALLQGQVLCARRCESCALCFSRFPLEGIEKDLYEKLVAASSRSSAGGALGNSICVCVLERMLPSFMALAGMPVDGGARDVWMAAVQRWRELGEASGRGCLTCSAPRVRQPNTCSASRQPCRMTSATLVTSSSSSGLRECQRAAVAVFEVSLE